MLSDMNREEDGPAAVTAVVGASERFSTSVLWKLMREFYARKGVDAWADGVVPFFITSNAHIARAYAKTVLGYLADLCSKGELDTSKPVYVVELGAGSGKFSFLLVKAILERDAQVAAAARGAALDIRYVMTDFTNASFDFWASHPALEPFVSSGSVDFAVFDASKDTEMLLKNSGEVLAPGTVANPLVVVANYLFDTLPADAFQFRKGAGLCEGLVTIATNKKEDEANSLDPEILNRFKATYEWNPVDPGTYYANETHGVGLHLTRIMEWYASRFAPRDHSGSILSSLDRTNLKLDAGAIDHPDMDIPVTEASVEAGEASLLIPIVSLRCIDNLSRISGRGGKMLIVSGDKGHSCTSAFLGAHEPHIAVHGSFSVMVNYHAMGLWCDSRGGVAFHSPHEESSLKVAAFVLGSRDEDVSTLASSHDWTEDCAPRAERAREWPQLRAAVSDALQHFGPNDFFNLQRQLEHALKGSAASLGNTPPNESQHLGASSRSLGHLKMIMAMLQLSDWDPDLVFKFRETILDHLGFLGARLQQDLIRGMRRAWANYFLLDRERDFAFEMGRFFYGIRNYEEAMHFYSISAEQTGEHHITTHNTGLCLYSLQRLHEAHERFERAIQLRPDYAKAQTWKARVEKELRLEGSDDHPDGNETTIVSTRTGEVVRVYSSNEV